MKTESITTEKELNLKLAELELRRLKSRAKRARGRFIEDIVFLVLIVVLMIMWFSAPHLPEELGENISHLASSAWQLLPVVLIIEALKRVISYRRYQTTEEE